MKPIWDSGVFEAVSQTEHPSPEQGGPCATCAFRPGSQASETLHTVQLAKLCVEAGVPFQCHEQPQLCRGFIAAVNARWADNPHFHEATSVHHREACRLAAHALADAIQVGVEADQVDAKRPSSKTAEAVA